ncbi:DUF3426 domain-containing protein [Roseateles sp. DC23W]|uniref:DUF3426 domain-containing protein n=1 Tax=Pelomonas dachongensis TaxID=3299029 RepID=A0ABW7EJX4_9BURK
MSLATRCTACGTVFRIVEDQLRVSDGWVRCGRCSEIFDARELLFDIEREAPPPWPAAFTPAPGFADEPPSPPTPHPLPPPAPAPEPEPEPEPEPAWIPQPVADPEPQLETPPRFTATAAPARQEPRWVEDEPLAHLPPAPVPQPVIEPAPTLVAEPTSPSTPVVPEFMRMAQNSARWNRPGMRVMLSASSLLLALLLLLQVTLHFRDALAALHPPLRGALQGLCSALGCEVQPWRRIEAISIEATSLSLMGGGSGYKLNLSLRNKTGVSVAAPWIELSLTDANGAPFARRVVAPEALQPQLKQVGAESEHALSFSFSTGGKRVSGYSVNVFYP